MVEIIPALIPKRFSDIEEQVSRVLGRVPIVQIDIVDGIFAQNKSWPYSGHDEARFQALIKEDEGLPFWQSINFEIDLMVAHPETVVDQWVLAGAERIVVHLESTQRLAEILAMYPKNGLIEIGLAIDLKTPISLLEPFIDSISFVQVMGIEKEGFQGQPFAHESVDHVAQIRALYPEITISVDGGVTLENAPELIKSGANRLVVGSAIFGSNNLEATIAAFKEL